MTTKTKYPELFDDLASEVCDTCASWTDDCNCDYCNPEVCVHSEQVQMLLRLCLEVNKGNEEAERKADALKREARKSNLRTEEDEYKEEYTDEELEAKAKAQADAEQTELFTDLVFDVCGACKSGNGDCEELNPQSCVHCAQMRELFKLCQEVEASRLDTERKAEALRSYAASNNLRPEEDENEDPNNPLYTTLEGLREQLMRIRERKAA